MVDSEGHKVNALENQRFCIVNLSHPPEIRKLCADIYLEKILYRKV